MVEQTYKAADQLPTFGTRVQLVGDLSRLRSPFLTSVVLLEVASAPPAVTGDGLPKMLGPGAHVIEKIFRAARGEIGVTLRGGRLCSQGSAAGRLELL